MTRLPMWPLGPSIAELARELGVNEERVRKEFHRWCASNNVDPFKYLRPRGFGNRYALPDEFVKYMHRLVGQEKHLVIIGGELYVQRGKKLVKLGVVE